MPAWPGGPCPECGEEMPENLVHCRRCRALLNTDLESDSVEIPAFVPLPEIESVVEFKARGYYVSCPHCDRELRIGAKYIGAHVTCKNCSGAFHFDFANRKITKVGIYADCPHCAQRIRLSPKYNGVKVACKHCSGRVILRD